MNRTITASVSLLALFLAACDRPPAVVTVPAPAPTTVVTTPGPPGPPGDTGATGNTGRPGDTAVVLVPVVPASGPSR